MILEAHCYLTADSFEESKIGAAGDELQYFAIKLDTLADSSAFAFEAFHVHAFEHIQYFRACKQSVLPC